MKGTAMNGAFGGRQIVTRLVLAIAAVATIAMPSTARAALISHSTAGVLINDGFEANTPGNFPTGWTVINRGGGSVSPADLEVENSTTVSGNPAAYEGSNFLAAISNNVGAYKTFASLTSGTITAQFAFYLPNGSGSIAPTFLKSAGLGIGPAEEYIEFDGFTWRNGLFGSSMTSGGTVDYYDGSGYRALTAGGSDYVFTIGAWHEVTMAYNIALGGATSALTITIDGTTLDALPTTNALASGSVSGFQIFQNSGGHGFIDAIPEPASATVLSVVGLALMGRRRRAAL